ncbi:hypothetical protein YIM73518_17940 [Thermus brockianus]
MSWYTQVRTPGGGGAPWEPSGVWASFFKTHPASVAKGERATRRMAQTLTPCPNHLENPTAGTLSSHEC